MQATMQATLSLLCTGRVPGVRHESVAGPRATGAGPQCSVLTPDRGGNVWLVPATNNADGLAVYWAGPMVNQ